MTNVSNLYLIKYQKGIKRDFIITHKIKMFRSIFKNNFDYSKAVLERWF
jgi:hypothetical protein